MSMNYKDLEKVIFIQNQPNSVNLLVQFSICDFILPHVAFLLLFELKMFEFITHYIFDIKRLDIWTNFNTIGSKTSKRKK